MGSNPTRSAYTIRVVPYKDPADKRRYDREKAGQIRRAYLLDKCCVACGTSNDLEVDHTDPRLKISHSVWTWNEARRAQELAKCQVLCTPCHRAKTKAEGSQSHPGERHPQAKLSESDVLTIRAAIQNGSTKRGLARDYGVNERLIRKIGLRQVWSHI